MKVLSPVMLFYRLCGWDELLENCFLFLKVFLVRIIRQHTKCQQCQQCKDLINWESLYNPKRLILERSKTMKKHQKLFFTLCLWARGWYLGQGNKEQAYFIWSAKAAPLIIKELEVLETFYARTSNLSSEFEPKANLHKAVRAPITVIW